MFDELTDLPANRRWRQQAFPVASVLALIRREAVSDRADTAAQYLLIQRQAEPYIGKWGLVGGRWEFGERLDTAITREVMEETNLDASFVALRGLVNERIAPRGPDDEGAHYLLFVCELHAATGTAREQSEGPVAWFSAEDLEDLKSADAIISTDYTILQHFMREYTALPYIEAEVVAGTGAGAKDELVRFSAGP
jgi:ADP-ribose pyrophosphatase YjhB (NUDIX family)